MGISGVPLDKDRIIYAIHAKKGVLKHAAQLVPCDVTAIYQWMDKDPEVANAVKEARSNADKERLDRSESLKDKAYNATEALLDECDVTTTIFIMKTLNGLKEAVADRNINVQAVERPYRDKNNTDSASV